MWALCWKILFWGKAFALDVAVPSFVNYCCNSKAKCTCHQPIIMSVNDTNCCTDHSKLLLDY